MNKFKKNEQEVTDVVNESKEVEKMGFWERNKNRILIGAISAATLIVGVVTAFALGSNDSDDSEEDLDESDVIDIDETVNEG